MTHAPHGPHGHAVALDDTEMLPQGFGHGRILFVDAFSGVAGDMFAAALLDLGVPLDHLERCITALPLEGVGVEVERCVEGSMAARRFHVRIDKEQSERSFDDITEMLAAAELPGGCRSLAQRIFHLLAVAEGRVHHVSPEKVHFHEVGAADSIVDVVAAAAGLTWLGARVVSSPLPMGRGSVMSRHGILPLPAPATLHCLSGVPTVPAEVEAELVTPTGAAIVAAATTQYVSWPALTIERIGCGAGTLHFENRPNVLRLVLGVPNAEAHGGEEPRGMVIVEANVDDMSGELAAYAIESLLEAGAVDAWAVPSTMKKGRPGLTISALVSGVGAEKVVQTLLRETTTIGVRQWAIARTERPRRTLIAVTDYGEIPVKVSEGPFGPAQVKPEFDACATAARRQGVPVRVVIEAALSAVRRH